MRTPRPRLWVEYQCYDSDAETGGREIIEQADTFSPRATGLLNASGQMLYREPERIGFHLRRNGS